MSAIRFATLIGALWMAACAVAWGQGDGPQRYYNIKAGPVNFTLSTGVVTEYTDNVNLANGTTTPVQSELTINPNFGITAFSQLQVTPVSETNTTTLSMQVNFGYKEYVFHPELNQNTTNLNIAPDSEISFLVRWGDYFTTRIHDGFGLETDPTSDGSLSNVAQFRRFTNTFGLDNRWLMNSNTSFEVDYSHRNVDALDLISLGSGTTTNPSVSSLSNVSDTVSATAQTKALSPFLTLGVRGSATQTTYPSASDQNSTSYSYGPFADLRLSEYTSLNASGGITETQSGGTFVSGTGRTTFASGPSNTTTEYANLSLINRMNTYYSQTFSVGRETTLSLLGSQTETNYVRYESQWRVNSQISVTFGLFAEDTTDLGMIGAASHYRREGGSMSTQYQLSRKLTTGLLYRYINKTSDDPLQSYQQNTITWTIDYRF